MQPEAAALLSNTLTLAWPPAAPKPVLAPFAGGNKTVLVLLLMLETWSNDSCGGGSCFWGRMEKLLAVMSLSSLSFAHPSSLGFLV